jgi:hypothetical protein
VKFAVFIALIAVAVGSGMLDKPSQIPLDCYGAETLVYTYEVDGVTIVDLDTGKFYNYERCIPLRFDTKGDM